MSVRRAISLRRGRIDRGHETLPSMAGALLEGAPPELAVLRARYKTSLEAALRTAIRGLSGRDRELLRLHLVERMPVDRLAPKYNVSRATAARWVAAARGALLQLTRTAFRADTGVTDSEFGSIARVLQSDLEVSIASELTHA